MNHVVYDTMSDWTIVVDQSAEDEVSVVPNYDWTLSESAKQVYVNGDPKVKSMAS